MGEAAISTRAQAVPSRQQKLGLVFVTRRTSGVGRRMESIVATLQTRQRGRLGVRTVDADAEPELVRRLGLDQLPAVVIVKDRRAVECVCGRMTLEELERVIARHQPEEPGTAS